MYVQGLKSEAISSMGVLFVIHLTGGNNLHEQLKMH